MALSEAQRQFLAALWPDGSPTGGWLIPTATREQDRARSHAKKHGLAVFDRKAWAWRITPASRAALGEKDSE